jgi:hypothetical protein
MTAATSRRRAHALLTAPLLVLAAAQCDGDPAAEAALCSGSKYVVLFVDRSASTRSHDLPAEVRDSLERIPERYLGCPGDNLHAFVVHKRTRGRALRLDLSNDLPPAAAAGGSRSDAVADSLEDAKRRAEFSKWASDQISTFIQGGSGPPAADDSTDLLGTLEVASDEMTDAPPGSTRWIIYLSDMFESMSGSGRRDFDARPPGSIAEAERWAVEDSARVLSTMRVATQNLSGARIRILSRPWGDRQGAEFVREYWYKLFSLVGIPRQQVRFY